MEKDTLTGQEIELESPNRNIRLKVVQFAIPKSLADEFKGACGTNGISMKDVIEEFMTGYVSGGAMSS